MSININEKPFKKNKLAGMAYMDEQKLSLEKTKFSLFPFDYIFYSLKDSLPPGFSSFTTRRP